MKYSKEDIKLKHLDLLTGDIDYQAIMIEIFQYKNTWLDRNFLFERKFRGIYRVVEEVRNFDIAQYAQTEFTQIKIPENVDMISYQARLEIGEAMQKEDLTDRYASTIAIACFETHYDRKGKYDSDGNLFKAFKEMILNRPMLEMLAVNARIIQQLNESTKMWNELFHKVEVIDPVYETVGGSNVLRRFSIQSTVKTMIQDFGFEYREVFMQPYVLIQSNMWEHQCRSYVQHLMTEQKEREMEAQRRKNK